MKDEWKFPTPVARLYRLLDVPNGVRARGGLGTLKKAHSYPGGCQIVLMREKERTKQKPHEQVMREYDELEVHPA